MWKDYSAGYIKNNRASSISVMIAALISSLFLSLMCSLFYNFWVYEVESIILQEGDWEGRITGTLSEEQLLSLQGFQNVKSVAVTTEQTDTMAVDLTFYNTRRIYADMPLIAERLNLNKEMISYHELLLSRYLIHDPEDREPPLLMAFYLSVLIMVSISLVLIIHNSFAISMDARVHQFGIFSSIGATPRQIRTCLMQEAAALCVLPIGIGSAVGIAASYGLLQAMNAIAKDVAGRHEAAWEYHPLVLIITILAAGATVLLSAWIPAGKLSRKTPLEAIRNTGEINLKKRKKSRVLSLLFGIEGELAGNALKAQKKALRTSALSLTLSFLGFTLMQCFFTLSAISTDYTYFGRYQDAWDVMVTVKDAPIEKVTLLNQLQNIEGIRDCVIYQKDEVLVQLPEEAVSKEVIALGGLDVLAAAAVSRENGMWHVKAPVVVMDDKSFGDYCKQIGITSEKMGEGKGSIVYNQIWDSQNSNFRYKKYVPYIEETQNTLYLQNSVTEGEASRISILGYTTQPPVLREEYDNYALVQFMQISTWEQIKEQLIENTGYARNEGSKSNDTYIRIRAMDGATLANLQEIEKKAAELMNGEYETEIENRIQEKVTNDYMIWGFQTVLGGICIMLAFIGIANVFSNTLGFLRQRRREFAQYVSVGMTPGEMKKMFCVEALVIAGRPLLITLPLTAVVVSFMISASYLNPLEFWERAPIAPIAVFGLGILGFVALAYYIGGKRIIRENLIEALRDDTCVI